MIFYTDGSAHPNPGPGGFGVVVLSPEGEILQTYNKGCKNTTNNAEEMKAILWAALTAYQAGESAIIYSDSAYAINTFSNWMYAWAKRGWIKSDGKIPENLDLVKTFYDLSSKMCITFHKVKGHNNNKFNELADKLATQARL